MENSKSTAPKIPFILGVTGRMAVSDDVRAAVKESFKEVVAWVRGDAVHKVLGKGLELGEDTPVWLLTSLAPGCDQVLAKVAKSEDLTLRAPLPFPEDKYRRSSSFTHNDSGDENRLADFSEVLGLVGEGEVFHVLTAKDVERAARSLETQLEKDLEKDNEKGRRFRYRAAGEYVSSYCDLLIACFEAEDPWCREAKPAAGTEWIVRSHLEGRREGVLPVEAPLSSADNGPIIQIVTPKEGDPPCDPRGLSAGELRFLAPDDCAELSRDFQSPAESERSRLRAQVKAIRFFNQDIAETTGARPHRKEAWAGEVLAEHFPDKECKTYRPAGRAKFRKTVEDCASALPGTAWIMDIRGFFPKKERQKEQDASPKTPADVLVKLPYLEKLATLRRLVADANRALDARAKSLRKWLFRAAGLVVALVQVAAFFGWKAMGGQDGAWDRANTAAGLALVIVGAGWLYYRHQRHSEKLLSRQNDTRAAAEALRVQLYWAAAGTGLSVASRYLQRSRGSVAAVRSVVSSFATPYEASRQRFLELAPGEQEEVLRRVLHGWVEEQEAYFGKKVHHLGLRETCLRFQKTTLVWAAVVLAVLTPVARGPGIDAVAGWSCTGLVLPVWVGACALFLAFGAWTAFLGWSATEAQVSQRSTARWLRWWVRSGLGAGLVVGAGGALALFFAAPAFVGPGLPGLVESDFLALCRNLAFGAAALVAAWSADQFLGENSVRYAAMREVFAGARARLGSLLKELQGSSGKERDAVLERIHTLLGALGNEAIHENTDWLQMHRNSPDSPPFPNVS